MFRAIFRAYPRIAGFTPAVVFALAITLTLAMPGSARAQDLSAVDVSGQWDVKLTASFAPNSLGITKGSGSGKLYLTQTGVAVGGLVVDQLGKCPSFELPALGLRSGNGFTLTAKGTTLDLVTCAAIGTADTSFLVTLLSGAKGTATGSGTTAAFGVPLSFTTTCTITRKSGLQSPTDPDGAGPGLPLFLIGKGSPGNGGVHDLALNKLTVPKAIKAKLGPVTKSVKVEIQNRSQHTEVIADAAMLQAAVELTAEVASGAVGAPVLVLHAPPDSKFPVLIKPRGKYKVSFDATFAGPADPLAPGEIGTITWTARVHHEALAGAIQDGHPEDDIAPRGVIAPYTFDTFPDGSIKEKGVGGKLPDKTLGAPILTKLTVGVP